jgi:hypothetical protein
MMLVHGDAHFKYLVMANAPSLFLHKFSSHARS